VAGTAHHSGIITVRELAHLRQRPPLLGRRLSPPAVDALLPGHFVSKNG
jgi:hypothetical protein